MEPVRLSVSKLCKSFSTPVLTNINLSVAHGEVHAIVGENGAGKTTLVNILAGLLPKDSGELVLDGDNYEPSNTQDGFAAGISCAMQELSLVGTLSVAENISLKNLPHNKFVLLKDELERRARDALRLIGLEQLSTHTFASALSLADRQLVELAKALSTPCRLLILDEPTSALTKPQSDHLHKLIAELAASGTSVIYISHRLNDVLAVSNTVSILRDGQVISSAPASSLSVPDIMEQMSGRNYQQRANKVQTLQSSETVLQADKITTSELPFPISFSCRKGEIVGIAGLTGAGKSELLSALFGLTPLTAGRVTLDTGKITIDTASHAVSAGLGYLGEDRQSMGVFAGQSVVANLMVPGISRVASSLGVVDRARERAAGTRLIDQLAIRCASPDQDIAQLSSGNQQKALIARWLHCDSELLLLDEPMRGVDVSTKDAIYDLFAELMGRKKSIVIASGEIDELMQVCTRILVLSDRKLVREFKGSEFSEIDILAAAFQEFTTSSPVTRPETGLPG